MNPNNYTSVYFAGIGGIGMSALARYFLANGKAVAGYDRSKTPLTEQLSAEGALIHYDDNVNLIPGKFKDPESTLIIYTPAIPASHSGLSYFKENGFNMLKRSQVLGLITNLLRGLCISGTHGKTTTSSLTAHIFNSSPAGCNAFLGGILKNYNSNLLLSESSDFAVVEADEYDRSFHHLNPYMAVITSTDPDHLDIYGTPKEYRESFEKFTSLIRNDGALIIKKGVDITPKTKPGVRIYTYSTTDKSADFFAGNIYYKNGGLFFDFVSPKGHIDNVPLGVPLYINIENAVAAMALATLNGIPGDIIKEAVKTFKGIQRRFDFKIKKDNIVYIDDYAHHPEELRSSIKSVKELYHDRRVTGIFQPHLYSRTRDFYKEFASALSLLDELILLDIYPAREEPVPGVTSGIIFDNVTIKNKTLCKKDELLQLLETKNIDILMTLGAGDIDRFINPITELLNKRYGQR
jgi:UDP-N-acetylmuramate--alanine ligase